jgi:signal transduction histidine kinase
VVRRIPIRAKVAGALAVPLLALVAVAGMGASASAAQARDVTEQADLASASIGHAGLIGALQNERNLAIVDMYGYPGLVELAVDDPEVARQLTDDAAVALRRSSADEHEALQDDYTTALEALGDLPEVRAQVDVVSAAPGVGNREVAHQVFDAYSAMVTSVFDVHDRFALAIDDAAIRHGDALVHDAFHASDGAARLVAHLIYVGTGPGGLDETGEAAAVAELRRDIVEHNASIAAMGTGPYEGLVAELLADPRIEGLSTFASDAIERGGFVDIFGLLRVTPLEPDGGYLAFRDEVVELVDARTRTLHDEAEARRRLYMGAAVAVVAAAVVVAWLVSRSITRPLLDLSAKARQMATYRLPSAVQGILDAPAGQDLVIPASEPIVPRSRDEVADVAGAFNDVQDSAIGLAVEQAALRRNVAESYVNLGRRSQNLLSRLLDAVAELEQGETDPRRQAQLHKLDHLATRIRRNAESLLVLSQADATSAPQAPVDIADIVRAALGEIENHERVMVRPLDPALVRGGASADLAHLLAELLENGLRHSPPRELVEVTGRTTGDGYEIAIVDHGLGMSPDEIERANQRLAGAESFTVTPAKYLGHYVTAVLAARHGIEVRLQGSVVIGIAARVVLPATLTAEASDAPAASPTAPVARGSGDGLGTERVATAVALLEGVAPSARAAEGREPVVVLPAVTAPSAPPRTVAPGGGAHADNPPERTASGLVRRVRGAHVPAGVAARRATGPDELPPPGPADAPSSPSVDGAEIQRFLTSLVGGVQRSLDEQTPAADAGDEV